MSVERIYWETDPFLAWFQEEAGKKDMCKGTIKRATAGEVMILTSALTVAEVIWRKGGPKLPEEKLAVMRKFFRRSCIRVVNVTRSIAEGAQEVTWNHNVKPKDAVHIATALNLKVGILETFDEQLLALTGRIGSPPLIIRKPIAPAQGDLGL